jgi:hypothetical protein
MAHDVCGFHLHFHSHLAFRLISDCIDISSLFQSRQALTLIQLGVS